MVELRHAVIADAGVECRVEIGEFCERDWRRREDGILALDEVAVAVAEKNCKIG